MKRYLAGRAAPGNRFSGMEAASRQQSARIARFRLAVWSSMRDVSRRAGLWILL